MKTTRKLAHAAILAAGFLATPLFVAACPANQAKPFTAGPIAQQPASGSWGGPFSEWVVDSNGVGLSLCTTSVTNDGNPPPCFYDPVNTANAFTSSLTRGGEAFYFLADSVFTTTDAAGVQGVDVVIVQGIESAFLSDPPDPATATQFSRLRTRVNVTKPGVYYVETPWGKTRYPVPATAILPPGNGQNRAEISEPIDITFNPGSNPGLVTPFLIATPAIPGFGPAQGYIGDGLTLTNVTGSPCGQNSVRITAFAEDDFTPLDINGGSNVINSTQFTVMGTLAPTSAVPLSVDAVYYSRKSTANPPITVNVMAESSASTSAAVVAAIPNAATATTDLVRDGNRFFTSTPVSSVPATISVTAADNLRPSTPNVQSSIPVKDLVNIQSATATCTGVSPARTCTLFVTATSSDDGTGPGGTPALTLVNTNDPLVNGSASVNLSGVPAVVTIKSSFGGAASKPVTIN